MLEFLTPIPGRRLGDCASNGLTAGNGIEEAGDAERRIDGEEPKEDRRLCDTGGGSMGKFDVNGVPGDEGIGDVVLNVG